MKRLRTRTAGSETNLSWLFSHMSQRTRKPTIRLERPAKDQLVSRRSLIRVFANRMCLLLSNYSQRDERKPLSYWMNVQADLTDFIVGFVVRLLVIWSPLLMCCSFTDHPSFIIEPQRQKTYLWICAPSEYSDQSAYYVQRHVIAHLLNSK